MDKLLERIESYNFECEAGPLTKCADWLRLKSLLTRQGETPAEGDPWGHAKALARLCDELRQENAKLRGQRDEREKAVRRALRWLVLALAAGMALLYFNCARAESTWTASLELGAEVSRHDEYLRGDDPLMYAMLRAEHRSGVIVYWRHQSSIPTGWPWNGRRDEMWVDALGVAYRWELGRW